MLRDVRAATDLPLVAYPNWGRVWNGDTYEWHGAGLDGFSADLLDRWQAAGASAIGGCCGIGPDSISDIAAWRAERA